MNRKQQATHVSYLNLQAVLERHVANVKFDEHVAFERWRQRWLERLENIESFSTQQAQLDSRGVTKDKQAKRRRLAEAALAVAKPARAWALENENAELAQTMAVSETALLRGSAKDATDLSQAVYDAASVTATAAALVSHGVSSAKLKALQDALKKFAAVVSKPRERITSRKSATERLAAEFQAAQKCLTEGLDLLVEQFEEDYPEFVTEFRNARVVVEGPTASNEVVELAQPAAKAA